MPPRLTSAQAGACHSPERTSLEIETPVAIGVARRRRDTWLPGREWAGEAGISPGQASHSQRTREGAADPGHGQPGTGEGDRPADPDPAQPDDRRGVAGPAPPGPPPPRGTRRD